MIKIKYFNKQENVCNHLLKGVFFTLLGVCIFVMGSSPVFGTDLTPDQQPETEIGRKIEELKTDIRDIKSQTGSIAPVSHELHAYFEESIGIIERLLGFVQLDISNGEPIAANIGLSEAGFLTSFLKEELEVAEILNTAVYREIDVTQHGLSGDGITNNREPLEDLLASLTDYKGQVELLFPEGKYYIRGESGGSALKLVDLENIVFKGVGDATLLFDGQAGIENNLLVADCKNLEFRNLSIDMRPVPLTLGTIISVENGNTIVIQICEGYPEPDKSYWTAKYLRGLVRDPKSGRIERDCGDPRVSELAVIGNGKYRLTLDDNSLSGNPNMTGGYAAGHLFSLHPRQRPGSGNSISIYNSRHLLFSHFNLYAADGHLFFIRGSAGIKFLDCDIIPKEGRLIMNNADGFHCQSNKKGIYLERCRVMHMNDDCMNFYSKLTSILDVEGDRIFTLLTSTDPDPEICSSYCAGDAIAFLNSNTGEFDGITTVKSIKSVDLGEQRNLLQIETNDPVPDIISRRSVGRPEKRVEREYTPSGGDNYRSAMAIDAPFEHMVMNLGSKNDGFIIRNCEFGYNRASGFKCKATNGVVRNTIFHDQVAVFLAELGWLEGTYPSKIEMTDVTIDRGIKYSGGLPGKSLPPEEAVRFMKYIYFRNVIDGSGNDIPAPDDIK